MVHFFAVRCISLASTVSSCSAWSQRLSLLDQLCRRGYGLHTKLTDTGLRELISERRQRHTVHAGCYLRKAIMQRFLQVSCQLCRLAVNREVTSQYPTMLQQAPGLTLGRYFSIMPLRDWDRQSVPCKMQSSMSLDTHQSTFAVQVKLLLFAVRASLLNSMFLFTEGRSAVDAGNADKRDEKADAQVQRRQAQAILVSCHVLPSAAQHVLSSSLLWPS